MSEMKYGLNLLVYTATFSTDEMDLVKKVADMGYDGVEIPFNDLSVLDAAATRRACESAGVGLTACCVVMPGTSISSPDGAERAAGVDERREVHRAEVAHVVRREELLAARVRRVLAAELRQRRRRVGAVADRATSRPRCGLMPAFLAQSRPALRLRTRFRVQAARARRPRRSRTRPARSRTRSPA